MFGGLVFFFCFSFFLRELEPFWLLVALNDGGQKYNPNASFLTIPAGRVMYVTGAHPVGTCWCLIWNLFGSVFYAFYFSIPLFFNSSGCLVVLCAHDNSLSLGWSLHPLSGKLIRAFCGLLYGGDIHPLSQTLLSFNSVPLIKVCPVAGGVWDFVLLDQEQNWVLDEAYRSIF